MIIDLYSKEAVRFRRVGAVEVRVGTECANVCWTLKLPVANVDLTVKKMLEHHIEIGIIVDDHLLGEGSEGGEPCRTRLVRSTDCWISSG